MSKQNIFSLAIPILILLSFPAKTFSQNTTTEEIFTIETYYPAPYGVYNEMRANKMVIGDSSASSTPSPATSGVVRFKGLGADPAAANDSQPGALYYNTNDNNFKYHNGTSWQRFGGLPLNYQWVIIRGAAIALQDGATATASCGVPETVPGCYNQISGIYFRADARYVNGQLQVRAQDVGWCDSGWITGTQVSCQNWVAGGTMAIANAEVTVAGVKIAGEIWGGAPPACVRCESAGTW